MTNEWQLLKLTHTIELGCYEDEVSDGSVSKLTAAYIKSPNHENHNHIITNNYIFNSKDNQTIVAHCL